MQIPWEDSITKKILSNSASTRKLPESCLCKWLSFYNVHNPSNWKDSSVYLFWTNTLTKEYTVNFERCAFTKAQRPPNWKEPSVCLSGANNWREENALYIPPFRKQSKSNFSGSKSNVSESKSIIKK